MPIKQLVDRPRPARYIDDIRLRNVNQPCRLHEAACHQQIILRKPTAPGIFDARAGQARLRPDGLRLKASGGGDDCREFAQRTIRINQAGALRRAPHTAYNDLAVVHFVR